MTANAPYYQLRGHSYQTSLNAHSYGPPEHEEYGIPTSVAPNAPMYTDSTQSRNTLDGYDNETTHGLPVLHLEQNQNHQLAELLEAANSAAGQVPVVPGLEADDSGNMGERRATRSSGLGLGGAHTSLQGKGKRKRVSSPPQEEVRDDNAGDGDENGASTRNKRARRSPANASHGQDFPAPDEPPQSPPAESSDFTDHVQNALSESMADSRTPGVHSAAALFRKPSSNTAKKYTRPPMSKLFMSLQLTPENFLHLQAQAKTYMLDAEHPERQNCVGNRGKGDTDMVKLRLFNCVQDFLNDGVGERFFGESVERPGEREAVEAARALGEGEDVATGVRKWVWPRDMNKIISLVTPLLRRMVTNERQRVYAFETRKVGAKKSKEGSEDAGQDHDGGGFGIGGFDSHEDTGQLPTLLDPALAPSYHIPPSAMYSAAVSAVTQDSENTPFSNMLSILITKSNTKLLPRVDIPSPTNSPYHDLSFKHLQYLIRQLLDRHVVPPSEPQGKKAAADSTSHGTDPALLRGLAAAAAGLDPDDTGDDSRVQEYDPTAAGEEATSQAQGEELRDEKLPTHVLSAPPPSQLPQVEIRAATGNGLVLVNGEAQWESAKLQVARAVWLEGRLMVVVEVL
ncbi:hypothetical protein K432DRAFT_424855 [Lepidopterella palustris CBS 459.81]|uniref:Uncharacterized protein n=1 Tax=Lepidopterella palustris CBS 459.81 TaxID=1314670 RepID=A0A8E2ECZ2_9PEZI|nr:hypothetical protein K432DRAFT_424855 [Lepidopterella palustris CBS 459.81]